MDDACAVWEGVAADLHDQTGCGEPPVDAFELADCCGVAVLEVERGQRARRSGDRVWIPRGERDVRQHGLLAHELGHWALERAGEPDSEDGARYLAGALLLPRQPFEADLRATQWDLRQLRARHLNASAEMIARRIACVRDAVVSIWDDGRLTDRVWSPWLADRIGSRRPSRFERDLAVRVLESGEALRAGEDSLLWSFPVFSPEVRRVIVVCEHEQLSLQFGRR